MTFSTKFSAKSLIFIHFKKYSYELYTFGNIVIFFLICLPIVGLLVGKNIIGFYIGILFLETYEDVFIRQFYQKTVRIFHKDDDVIRKQTVEFLKSVKVKVSVVQSCPALCNPKECGPPGSSVNGILQTGILEWVAFLSLGDLSDSGIEPGSSALQVDSLLSEPPGKTLLTSIQLYFFYCLLATQGPEILCQGKSIIKSVVTSQLSVCACYQGMEISFYIFIH